MQRSIDCHRNQPDWRAAIRCLQPDEPETARKNFMNDIEKNRGIFYDLPFN